MSNEDQSIVLLGFIAFAVQPSSISWKLLNKLNKLTQFQLRGWGEDTVNPPFVFCDNPKSFLTNTCPSL